MFGQFIVNYFCLFGLQQDIFTANISTSLLNSPLFLKIISDPPPPPPFWHSLLQNIDFLFFYQLVQNSNTSLNIIHSCVLMLSLCLCKKVISM